MYNHVYGVKWLPWSVTYEINYFREGVRGLKYSLSLIREGAVQGASYPLSLIFLKAGIVMFMVLNGHHGVFLSKLTI